MTIDNVTEQHEESLPVPCIKVDTTKAKKHWHHWKSAQIIMIHTFECTICKARFIQETKSAGK